MPKPLICARLTLVATLALCPLAASLAAGADPAAADPGSDAASPAAPGSDTAGAAGPGPDAAALTATAQAASARGELPEAARDYRRAALASDDEDVAEQATRFAFDNFQLTEALVSAERWLAINPSSEQAERYAGVSALALHRLDDAERHFHTLVESAYVSPAAGFVALLPLVMDEATATDVTELFRRLSASDPKVAEGHDAVGNAALRSENSPLALSSAAEAVRLAPYWVPAKLLLARATIEAGHEAEGLAMARDLAVAPDSEVSTHVEYALMLASVGRDEEARAVLTPYATGNTVVPAAVRTLGVLDLQDEDLKAAATRFEELLSMGSQSYDALYFLGVIAERRKDDDLAERYYARVTTGDQAVAAQRRRADIEARRHGLDAGLARLEQFGKSQPSYGPQVFMAEAALLSSHGDDARALGMLDQGIARYPDVLDLRLSRVFAYDRLGRSADSVRDLRQLLAERPGDPVVQNALGYTLADQDRDLAEAHSLVAASLEQSPDSAAVQDSMGWVLYREKNYPEALDYLRKAQARDDDPEICLHLGEVQWAMGDRAAARKTWREALERHPGSKPLEERLARAGR
jgi:tetratricopeptide (TPR) repeat protein